MARYSVAASAPFEDDLDAAVSWRLREVGPASAARLLDAYDGLVGTVGSFPGLGTALPGSDLRWMPLERFVAVYSVDDGAGEVILLRLFHMSADWRSRILGE